MYKIDAYNISEEFLNAWRFAGESLTNQGQGSLNWIRAHLHQPFDVMLLRYCLMFLLHVFQNIFLVRRMSNTLSH